MKYVFSSFPDFSDNAFILTKYMLDNNIKGKYVWLIDTKNVVQTKEKAKKYIDKGASDIHFVKKRSLWGVYHYLTAAYSFHTHGLYEQLPLPKKQIKTNLWHGMPLKNIGKLAGSNFKFKMDKTLSTSPLFDEIIANSFCINPQQIIELGLPRNDLFFQKTNFSLKSFLNYSGKVIVWMPTYRKSNIGDIREDGMFAENELFGFTHKDMHRIDEIIGKKKMKVVIKLHPMDILNEREGSYDFKNIIVLTKYEFNQLNIETNDFLKESDGLITDYSSVYFDYLLLDRPIGLIMNDVEDYSQSRGFVSQKVVDNYTGEQISDSHSFGLFLDKVEKNEFNLPKELFNKYDKHGRNCQELLKQLRIY